MKTSIQGKLLFSAITFISLAGCKKDTDSPAEKPFVVTGYYVAGTITPKSNAYVFRLSSLYYYGTYNQQ